VWSQCEQIPRGVARRLCISELPVSRCQGQTRAPETGHVDLERVVQRATVVALAVRVEERTKPIPSGMVRVELPGPYRQRTTALPVSGISDQETQIRRGESVHWVEGDGAIRGDPESLDFPPKVLHRG